MPKRDFSVDVLKFLAALLITNSHMEILYGEYSFMATGGAIGDALFFFCSGYTLFLGRNASFFNWYKRRINRIYPTIFAWALVYSAIVGVSADFVNVLLHGGGWFVECIMIYYAILWFVKRYFVKRLGAVFLLASAIILVRYFIGGSGVTSGSIYGDSTFKYWLFFLTMLAGAMLGIRRNSRPYNPGRGWVNLVMLIASAVCFYALLYLGSRGGMEWLQLLSVFALIGFAEYLYRLCNSRISKKAYENRITGPVIRCVGGLCLEIYLVQYPLFTDKMNSIFPLNLLIMYLIIIAAAYVLRCLSRLWKQTFSEGNYNWKEIISPY